MNLNRTRKTHVLVKIRVHFIAEGILARKLELNMGGIDGAVGGCILLDGEGHGRLI